ncbi:MAG: hypothetical protein NTZ32_12725 [Planctomycetales bacterium]|nr:hypothetical protein [Planctomycetales bacterium]
MSLSMPEPILAALDIGQIFWLIVVSISVVSWIVNVIQGNPQNGAPRPQNRPKDPVQSELEKFLQEVVGGKRPVEQNRPAVPQQKQSRNANEKKGGKPKQQRSAKSNSSSQRQGERVVQSTMPTTNFDDGVRSQHLQTSMEPNRIEAAVQRDIDGAVLQDLGSDRSRETGQRADNPHPLVAVLRSPQGIRQAILLNEVLGKPKALR